MGGYSRGMSMAVAQFEHWLGARPPARGTHQFKDHRCLPLRRRAFSSPRPLMRRPCTQPTCCAGKAPPTRFATSLYLLAPTLLCFSIHPPLRKLSPSDCMCQGKTTLIYLVPVSVPAAAPPRHRSARCLIKLNCAPAALCTCVFLRMCMPCSRTLFMRAASLTAVLYCPRPAYTHNCS